ncbi:MAG: hypothetical protein D6694_05945, partial [Gammaproteobacteria bacterium]
YSAAVFFNDNHFSSRLVNMNPFDIFRLNVLGRFLLGASGASVSVTGRLILGRIDGEDAGKGLARF